LIDDLQGHGSVEDRADVIVIGGGTAGLPASVLIARETGAKIVCLESGDRQQLEDTHALNEVVHLATEHKGATHGRFRCLGGSSTRWGGVMLPFQQADLERADWPITMSDLEDYVSGVEDMFGLQAGPYTDHHFPFDLGETHVNRLAKRPTFKRRNVIDLVGKASRELPNLSVWLNATVTEIRAAPNGNGVEVVARALSGESIRIAASRLVIAAGAIETTRLALLADQQNGGVISAGSPSLGHYFSDHISIGVAEIEPIRLTALNKVVGFRFDYGGGLRPIRFELAPEAAARDHLPPSYAYVDFEVQRSGSFDALREIFRCLQMRSPPPAPLFASLLRDMPWLTHAAWWRFAWKRLLYPVDSRLVVHISIEQEPADENRITLSKDRFDPLGVPLAEIDWRISDRDVDNLNRTTDLFEETWNRSGLATYGVWKRFPQENINNGFQSSGGVFHPTGSTRMARDPASGVVDSDLRLFALPQIQLLSTSVLPTGGGANPTMMLMMLMLRCVAQFGQTL
jgi:choline dehydrogenase-like flavoprotein